MKPTRAHSAWDAGPMRRDPEMTRDRAARLIRQWRRNGLRVHRYSRTDGVAFTIAAPNVFAAIIFLR